MDWCQKSVPLLSERNKNRRRVKRRRTETNAESVLNAFKLQPVCNLSAQTFSKIVRTAAFVDKTLYIKDFLEGEDDFIQVWAPRRFGKSTNMDMLREFLLGRRRLFEVHNLKIHAVERNFFDKHCVPNPVIYLSFSNVTGNNFEQILDSLREILREVYGFHKHLVKRKEGTWVWSNEETMNKLGYETDRFVKYWLKSENLTETEIVRGFSYLSVCLYASCEQRVYVLIDDYDVPILKGIFKEGFKDDLLTKIIDIIRDMTYCTFKNNKHIERGLIYSCTLLGSLLSRDVDRIVLCGFLGRREFSRACGFTYEEVSQLLSRPVFSVVGSTGEIVKEFYNNYKMGFEGSVYNTYSILNYLFTSFASRIPQYGNYWVESGYFENLEVLFAKPVIRRLIEELVHGSSVRIPVVRRVSTGQVMSLKSFINSAAAEPSLEEANFFLQFLCDCGYFSANEVDSVQDITTIGLTIPNKEIMEELRKKCYSVTYVKNKHLLSQANMVAYAEAIQSIVEHVGSSDAFSNLIETVYNLFEDGDLPKNSTEFHCVLFTLAYNIKEFIPDSELKTRRMKNSDKSLRFDMLLNLHTSAVIMELKCDSGSASDALVQNISSGSHTVFVEEGQKDYEHKVYVGLHLDSEGKVSLTYTVNSTDVLTANCITFEERDDYVQCKSEIL